MTTPAAQPPTIAPRPKPANKASNTKALGLLAKRAFEKYVLILPFFHRNSLSSWLNDLLLFCFQASARQIDWDHFIYRSKNVHLCQLIKVVTWGPYYVGNLYRLKCLDS